MTDIDFSPARDPHCAYSDPCLTTEPCLDRDATHEELNPGEHCHIRGCGFVVAGPRDQSPWVTRAVHGDLPTFDSSREVAR